MKVCSLSAGNACAIVVLFGSITWTMSSIHALTVGSNTSVSRQGEANFGGDTDNEILGFTYMEKGFTFDSATTTCSYNALFTVAGTIALNGGQLFLLRDLRFTETGIFDTSGTVSLNSHTVFLTEQDHKETGTLWWDSDGGGIAMQSRLSLASTWTFSGSITVNGNGNTLAFDPDGVIEVEEGSDVTFRNIVLDGLSGNNLRARGGNASITFDNTDLRLSGNYTLTGAAFFVENDVRILGRDVVFTYTAPYKSQVRSRSRLYVDRSVTFSYDSSFVGAVSDMKTRLSFADKSSLFHLNGCTLHITYTGFKMTGGTLIIENDVRVRVDGDQDHQVMELDSAIDTDILGGSSLIGEGVIKYV